MDFTTSPTSGAHCGGNAPRRRSLLDVVSEFRCHGIAKACSTSDGAVGKDLDLAIRFARELRDAGFQAEILRLAGSPAFERAHPKVLEVPTFFRAHYVVRVAGYFIVDWTARQFDPDAAFPLMSDDVATLGWADVDVRVGPKDDFSKVRPAPVFTKPQTARPRPAYRR